MTLPLRVLHLEQSEKDAVQVLTALKKGGVEPVYKLIQTRKALIAELDNAWDVILSGTNLPQITVFEALQIMHEHGLQLPFFVISDSVGEETAAALIQAGASDFVKKDRLSYLVPSIKQGLVESAFRKEQRRVMPGRTSHKYTKTQSVQSASADPKGIEALRDVYHQRLEMVNQLAIELAALPQDADFTAFIAVKLKQITGAYVVAINEYSKEEKLLHSKYITIDSKLQQEVNNLLRNNLLNNAYAVDEKTYQWITRSVVAVIGDLAELTFCVIPETTSRPFKKLLGLSSFAELGFVYQEELMGTATLIFDREQPLPPAELLYPLSNIIAVSWRRKKAEESNRENEARYRTLFENSPIGIYRTTHDGQVLNANPALLRLLGFNSLEELTQYNLEKDWYPADYSRPKFRESIKRVGSINGLESTWVRRDGQKLSVRENVRLIPGSDANTTYYDGTVEDITAQKKAEEGLREANQFSHEVITGVDGGIIVYDLELHVQLWNPFMEKITGLSSTAALGKKAGSLFPAMWSKDPAQILAQINLGESVTTPTIPYHSPMDGKSGWISVTFSPRRSAAGSIVGIIAMVQDITRIKEMDNEIARQAARAEALVHTAGRLNAQLDLDTLLKTVCEETILALGVSAVVILLMDENTNVLSYASDIGIPAEIDRQRLYMPVALLKDYPFISADQTYLADFHTLVFNPPESVFSTMKVQTSACALIRRDDQLVGALTLFTFAQPRSFSHDEQELFRGLADQAAQAIVNARLFENVHRHLQQVRALHEIDVAITSNVNRALSLDVILKHVTEQLGVDTACILLLNSRTQILEFAAGHGFRTDALKYTRLELGESYAGRAAQDGRPIRVPDLRASGPFIPSPSFSAEGFISYQNTPLIAKGHVIGVLEIFNRTLLNPDATWLEFFEALSTQAAIAIDNISLFDNLQQSNVELAQAYDTTLEGWSRALELRDKETQGHTRRVAEMTGYLAEKIGLAGADLVQIRRGALLHDIGKMGIPDSILLKNGPLTAEEWLVMQKHPVYAYELLSPIAYLRSALEIPYCHHEKWDGTGYPRRLKGEEIPLGSRIFTIVDVWDALISDRPYRPAWTEEKALEYIKGQAGRHFDPQVTSLFITMIELKQFGPKPINLGANFDMIDNDYPLLGDDDRRQS